MNEINRAKKVWGFPTTTLQEVMNKDLYLLINQIIKPNF